MVRLQCALSIAMLWLAPTPSRALSVAILVPATVGAGSSFDVEIYVAGAPELGDFAAPSLRAFDFDLTYDPSQLAYEATNVAEFLGTLQSQALVSESAVNGVVDLKEVSLLSGGALDASQPQDFLVATLRFQAVGTGSATLALTQRDLADVEGSAWVVAGSSAATVDILPEPGSSLLLGAGILALAACAPRGRSS